MQGLNIGVGLFLANAVVLPLLSEKSFASGVREGAIGGVLAVALFAIVAAVKPAKSSELAKAADADSEGPA
jgi:hypothetical protein